MPAALSSAATLELDADASHYLISVMRLKAGRQLRVFNARDGEYLATLLPSGSSSKRGAAAVLVDTQLRPSDASASATAGSAAAARGPLEDAGQATRLHLYFAPIKKARLKGMLEKATELGVDRLVPVLTQNVNERYDEGSAPSSSSSSSSSSSYRRILVEAAEQSERLSVPELAAPVTLSALLRGLGESGTQLLVCRERLDGGKTLLQALLGADVGRAAAGAGGAGGGGDVVSVLVGPEGGFTSAELSAMEMESVSRGGSGQSGSGGGSAGRGGVVFVSLGRAVLRADTAAVAALSVARAVADARDGRA